MATSPTVKAPHVVIGMNYDDSQLAEHRHLTRQELDSVSTDMPVFVIHKSGHIGVYNSKALAMFGITAKTPNPAGGLIEREADRKTPSGVMQENAHFGIAYNAAEVHARRDDRSTPKRAKRATSPTASPPSRTARPTSRRSRPCLDWRMRAPSRSISSPMLILPPPATIRSCTGR
jgi:hypothetical protein